MSQPPTAKRQGKPGRPGLLRIVQGPDGTTAIIDGAPLVPGPPALQGQLPITLDFSEDADAQLVSVRVLPPTAGEIEALASARKADRKSRDDQDAQQQQP